MKFIWCVSTYTLLLVFLSTRSHDLEWQVHSFDNRLTFRRRGFAAWKVNIKRNVYVFGFLFRYPCNMMKPFIHMLYAQYLICIFWLKILSCTFTFRKFKLGLHRDGDVNELRMEMKTGVFRKLEPEKEKMEVKLININISLGRFYLWLGTLYTQ